MICSKMHVRICNMRLLTILGRSPTFVAAVKWTKLDLYSYFLSIGSILVECLFLDLKEVVVDCLQGGKKCPNVVLQVEVPNSR